MNYQGRAARALDEVTINIDTGYLAAPESQLDSQARCQAHLPIPR
jgi:hypothetical protein